MQWLFLLYSQPKVTGNFLTCPRWDSNPDRGERQLVVGHNGLDHTAIRAGPATFRCHLVRIDGTRIDGMLVLVVENMDLQPSLVAIICTY